MLGQDVRRGAVVDDRDARRSSGVNQQGPASVSPVSARSVCGPVGTTAGLAPRNDGVLPMTCPSASVTWTATWCPPTRHDHGARASGSPKTANQYNSGSRRVQPSRRERSEDRFEAHDRADLAFGPLAQRRPEDRRRSPPLVGDSCPEARGPPGCPACTPRRTVRSYRTGRRPLPHAGSRRARRAGSSRGRDLLGGSRHRCPAGLRPGGRGSAASRLRRAPAPAPSCPGRGP